MLCLLQPQICGVQFYWNITLRLMFSSSFYKFCQVSFSAYYLIAVGSYVKGFYNLISAFALKNSCCKTFWKTAENPVKNFNFLFLSGFSLSVLQKSYQQPFPRTLSRDCFYDDLLPAKIKSWKKEIFRKK